MSAESGLIDWANNQLLLLDSASRLDLLKHVFAAWAASGGGMGQGLRGDGGAVGGHAADFTRYAGYACWESEAARAVGTGCVCGRQFKGGVSGGGQGLGDRDVVDVGERASAGSRKEVGDRCERGARDGAGVGVVSGDGQFAKVDEVGQGSRGRWYWHNKRKKQNAKLRRANWRVPEARESSGFCETVLSTSSQKPPSYVSELSEAERLARESLARRRAAENAVAEKLAEMKLASLKDEKRCQEYADLKRQRIVQWQNEALAKSQASLDKCKSIDPGSSSSQYEIRRQAKENEDMRYEREVLVRRLKEKMSNSEVDELIAECKAPGEATLDELDMCAAHWAPPSCSSGDPADGYI